MASPERRIWSVGIERAVLAGVVLASLVYGTDLYKLGDSSQKPEEANTSANKYEASYEVSEINENLTLSLHWIAFRKNPAFDTAIAELSKIQGEIIINRNLSYISHLETNSLDEKYADVLYMKDENGEHIKIVLSADRFLDGVLNSAVAGRDLLIAWKKYELAKNEPQRFRDNLDFGQDLEKIASIFVDVELARR